jgi:hypothetical protein
MTASLGLVMRNRISQTVAMDKNVSMPISMARSIWPNRLFGLDCRQADKRRADCTDPAGG